MYLCLQNDNVGLVYQQEVLINPPRTERESEERVGSGRGSKGTIYGGREVKEGAKCPEIFAVANKCSTILLLLLQ